MAAPHNEQISEQFWFNASLLKIPHSFNKLSSLWFSSYLNLYINANYGDLSIQSSNIFFCSTVST